MLNSALQLLSDDLPKFGKKPCRDTAAGSSLIFLLQLGGCEDSGAHKLPLN